MVCKHTCRQLGIECLQWRQDLGATGGVRVDRSAVARRELRNIVHDVEQRFVDLADVVEERNAFHGALLVRVESCSVCDDKRACGDAADMHAGIRVIRLDGVEERFERGSGKSLEGLRCSTLAGEQRSAADGADDEREARVHVIFNRKNRAEQRLAFRR